MINKKQIAKEVAEEHEYKCPGIDEKTVEFCVDSVIESMKKVMYDDTVNTVRFQIPHLGIIMMDYYISMSKVKEETDKKSNHYKATYQKLNFLKNLKKDRKEKSREYNYTDPILKRYYEKLNKKRIRYIHGNFYNYWKQIALNHNENHQ